MATSADTPLWPGVLALCAGALIAQRLWPLKSRPLALGLVLLTLPLVPSLFVAERLALENRLYLPAVGLALIAAEVAERVPSRGRLGEAIAFVLVALCATVTWKYEAQFRDKRSFVQAARLASPSSALARVEMGGVYYEQDHNLDSAEAEYREAIALDPSEPVAHNDLGVLLMARHRWQDAADQLRQEIPSNPTFAVAYYNLGIVLRELGRPDDAAAQWQLALQHDATHINSMGELLVYFAKRHMLERVEHYEALLAKQGIDVSVTNDGEVKAVPR
jgi:tetratricopeptide (TPR) repeat protein